MIKKIEHLEGERTKNWTEKKSLRHKAVKVGDYDVETVDVNTDVRVHGDIELDNDEKEAMKLLPKNEHGKGRTEY